MKPTTTTLAVSLLAGVFLFSVEAANAQSKLAAISDRHPAGHATPRAKLRPKQCPAGHDHPDHR